MTRIVDALVTAAEADRLADRAALRSPSQAAELRALAAECRAIAWEVCSLLDLDERIIDGAEGTCRDFYRDPDDGARLGACACLSASSRFCRSSASSRSRMATLACSRTI